MSGTKGSKRVESFTVVINGPTNSRPEPLVKYVKEEGVDGNEGDVI